MPSITSSITKVQTKKIHMFQHHYQPNITLPCASIPIKQNQIINISYLNLIRWSRGIMKCRFLVIYGKLADILPLARLFSRWLGFVPPMNPINTICFTPAALAVNIEIPLQQSFTRYNLFCENINWIIIKNKPQSYQHQFDSFGQSNPPETCP
jgi:hypothetical protein